MNIGDLVFGLRGDGAPLKKDATAAGADAGEAGAKSFDKSFSGRIKSLKADLGKGGGIPGALMGGIGVGAGLAAFSSITSAVGTAVDMAKEFVTLAEEEQAGIERLNASLKANVAGWNGNTDAIEKVIAEREKLAFSDGDQRDSLAKLVAITHDVNKALGLQRQAMDLARLRGMSLADASTVLGKVYSGNVGVLKRYGIAVKAGASATEALGAISKQTAGQAEAYANTTQGAMESLDIAIEDAKEAIGQKLLPVMKDAAVFARDQLVPAILGIVDAFDKIAPILAPLLTNNLGGAEAAANQAGQDIAAQIVLGIIDGIVVHKPQLETISEAVGADTSKQIAKGMTTAMPDIEHAAAKIPEKIGKGLRSQRDHVRSAMVALKYEMEHPITLAENIAYLRARLFSKALARGLRSNIPAIRQAAQDAWAVIAQNLVNNIDTNGSLQWAAQQGDPSERAKARAAIWAITHPKHRAAGGPVTRGMTYMVGERGPERFVPATDGTIVPHGGRQDVWHHLDQTAARNIVAVGGDAAGVAAILLSASQSAGARYSTPRRS